MEEFMDKQPQTAEKVKCNQCKIFGASAISLSRWMVSSNFFPCKYLPH